MHTLSIISLLDSSFVVNSAVSHPALPHLAKTLDLSRNLPLDIYDKHKSLIISAIIIKASWTALTFLRAINALSTPLDFLRRGKKKTTILIMSALTGIRISAQNLRTFSPNRSHHRRYIMNNPAWNTTGLLFIVATEPHLLYLTIPAQICSTVVMIQSREFGSRKIPTTAKGTSPQSCHRPSMSTVIPKGDKSITLPTPLTDWRTLPGLDLGWGMSVRGRTREWVGNRSS